MFTLMLFAACILPPILAMIRPMPLENLYVVAIILLFLVGGSYAALRRYNQTEAPSDFPNDTPNAAPFFARRLLGREASRGPVTALLLLGILLIWLGQSTYRQLPEGETRLVLLLMVMGGLMFLFGGQTAVRNQTLQGIITTVQRICAYFRIAPWQLVLLLSAPLFMLLTSAAAGTKLEALQPWVANLSWLLAIGLLIVGSYRQEKPNPLADWEVRTLAFLFVLGLVLRGLLITSIPYPFSGDEGSAGLTAVQFYKGTADNWFVTGWFSFPSLYFALQSVAIHIWGQTIAAARLVSVLVGGLSILATYWLARSMFDKVTAVFAAFYLTISHYHIHVSRIALNNIYDALFGAVALYGFWDGWKNGRRSSYIWCGVALGVGMYFYVSIRILPLIFLLWSAAALLRHRQQFLQRLPDLILATWISALIALPLGLYFYRFPDQFNAPLDRVTILGPWLENEAVVRQTSELQIVLQQMWLGVLGFVTQPLRLLYEPGAPLLLTGAATLFLIGLLWGIFNFDLRYLLLVLPFVATVISNGISQNPPAAQRYIFAMPMVAIFVAIPLAIMADWFKEFWPKQQWLGLVITGALAVAVAYQDVYYYFAIAQDSYIYGGVNTLIATEVAYYLEEKPETDKVYFFGFPRMGYFSLSTIPYLVPEIEAQDIAEPIREAPAWELDGVTQFMFLPERIQELGLVQDAYPNGRLIEMYDHDGDMVLFVIYEVDG